MERDTSQLRDEVEAEQSAEMRFPADRQLAAVGQASGQRELELFNALSGLRRVVEASHETSDLGLGGIRTRLTAAALDL